MQRFAATFAPGPLAQLIAYSNVLLILVGVLFIKDEINTLSKTAKMWFGFYLIYYCIGLLSSVLNRFDPPILRTLVPIINVIGFYFFLGIEKYRPIFFKTITLSYLASSILTIVLFKLNFDFDKVGKTYSFIDRAGGVWADANNAALVSIITYLLFDKYMLATNTLQKILKIVIKAVIFYSLFITFSTTGLFVFVLVTLINNYKFFSGLKMVFFGTIFVFVYASLFTIDTIPPELNLSPAQNYKLMNLKNVLTFNTDEIDNSGRGALLEHLLEHIYKNPIIGNGIEFSVVMRGHNTYLGIWADAGLIVFLLFISILILYLLKSFFLKTSLNLFCFTITFTLVIFMYSLQSVLNQPYLMILFMFIGYIIDFKLGPENIKKSFNALSLNNEN